MLDNKIEKATDFLWNIQLKYEYKEVQSLEKFEEQQ